MTEIKESGTIRTSAGGILLRMWHAAVSPGVRGFFKHSHTSFEITLVLAGSGTYQTQSGDYGISPGDMLVFASNEQHNISLVEKQGLEILNMHFEPLFIAGDTFTNANLCFSHSKYFKNFIPKENCEKLCNLMLCAEKEIIGQKEEYVQMIHGIVCEMLITLLREHGYRADDTSASQFSGIQAALKYIEPRISSPLTLYEIASAAGLSPNYFSLLFKKACKISLWDYIVSKRVEIAQRMLTANPHMNILDIALSCGFNSTANFNKAFRRFSGITPKEYRKSDDLLH